MDVLRLLPNDRRAAARARHVLDGLRAGIPATREPDVRLAVSELVTNAVKHAGASPEEPIELRVRVAKGVLRLEVRDRGQGFPSGFRPARSPPALPAEGGMGLYLVSRLTDRWGVDMDGHTSVWAEFDLAPAG